MKNQSEIEDILKNVDAKISQLKAELKKDIRTYAEARTALDIIQKLYGIFDPGNPLSKAIKDDLK